MNRVSRARSARAFSMAEAILSVFIVGVVLVAALHTVGASGAAQQKVADRARGMLLAQDLMTEILQHAYEDPASGPGSFGLGADEVGDGSRSLWDDVDDYEGWSALPPQRADGEPIEGFVGWGRRVAVEWVDPDDLTQTRGFNTGVKRITVTVTHHDVPVASLVAVRTSVWPNSGDGGGGGDPVNNPPTAVASCDRSSGEEPLTVWFWGGDSTDPDPGDTLTYAWDFGDGGSGSGEMTNYTYWNDGTYMVTLTVSDGRGGVDTDTLTINVWD